MTDPTSVRNEILSKIGNKVRFTYAGGVEKHGILKDRAVVESTNAFGVPYWDVVDLIEFEGEDEPELRIGYYRKNEHGLRPNRAAITEPVSIWKKILVKTAREKPWFRDLLEDVMKGLEK